MKETLTVLVAVYRHYEAITLHLELYEDRSQNLIRLRKLALKTKLQSTISALAKTNSILPKPLFGFLWSQLVEGFLLISEESFVVVFAVVFAFLIVMFLI